MKVLINTNPLNSGHKTRGIGFYTKNLIESLKKIDQLKIVESDNNSTDNINLVHYPFFDLFQRTLEIKKDIPTIVTIHDVIPLIFFSHYPPGLKGSLKLFFQKKSLKKVKRIITDSECSKKDINKFLGVPSNKISVIYLAPGKEFKQIKDNKILKLVSDKYKLPKDFALFAGSVNWNKNLLNLTQACIESDLDLVLVGKDFEDKTNLNHPERKSYQDFLTKFSQNPKVHILGFVETEDLVALYNLAKCILLPSFYEGFGLPILEAQTCGVPVITSNVSSMPEVAGDGAIFVDPNSVSEIKSAIQTVISGNDINNDINNVVKRGFKNLERFSWDETAQKTYEEYKEATKN